MYTAEIWSFCDTSDCSSVQSPASQEFHDNVIHFITEGKLLAFKVKGSKLKIQQRENKRLYIKVYVCNKNLRLIKDCGSRLMILE